MSNLDTLMKLQTDTPKQALRRTPGEGDPEIKAMLEEFDFLSLIRSDTGEQGRQGSDYIAFHNCPICGTHDCFRYYPSTDTWFCFDSAGDKGGSALEYYMARERTGYREAVAWLREETGHPYESRPKQAKGEPQAEQAAEGSKLPAWTAICASNPPERRKPLISGLLRQGHVGVLSGKAKTGKSWLVIYLAVAVALGGEWLGHTCMRGDVLYIDPEIDPVSLDNRFHDVCDALGVDAAEVDSHVFKWSLRCSGGVGAEQLAEELTAARQRFALVIIDSVSVFLGDGDENSVPVVRKLLSGDVQRITATGAAVLCVHHHGKGKPGDRDASDRSRGSSVWTDAPDTVLVLTEIHGSEPELPAGSRALELVPILREFADTEPDHIIWTYPLHSIDSEGITADWKPSSSQSKGGHTTAELKRAKTQATYADICANLLARFYTEGTGADGMTVAAAAKTLGIDSRRLEAAIKDSPYLEMYEPEGKQRKRSVRVVAGTTQPLDAGE